MVSLMILLLALTGTTYAWFKINSSASVTGFNFTVTGGEGYQISLNGDLDSYSSQLTSAQMRQAILCGFDSGYQVRNGKLYYGTSTNEISDNDAKALIKSSILLSPATPHKEADGTFTFRNQYGSTIYASSGKFIEFSLYVKANGVAEDQNYYDLYLLGSDVNAVDSGNNEVVVSKCSIRSLDKNEITLKRDMNTTLYGALTQANHDKVTVYTSNALRFSIGDDYETTDDLNLPLANHTNKIFEISDDVDYDLGSYATDYDMATDTSTDLTPQEKLELDNLYNADKNAMFTYYNNIRPYSQLTKLEYATKPDTIRHLATEKEISQGYLETETVDDKRQPFDVPYKFVRVRSGWNAKRVTFRFWLEGWDADCFDGISQSIRVNLSFGSFKNEKKSR